MLCYDVFFYVELLIYPSIPNLPFFYVDNFTHGIVLLQFNVINQYIDNPPVTFSQIKLDRIT